MLCASVLVIYPSAGCTKLTESWGSTFLIEVLVLNSRMISCFFDVCLRVDLGMDLGAQSQLSDRRLCLHQWLLQAEIILFYSLVSRASPRRLSSTSIAPSSPHWVNTNPIGQKSSAVPTAQRQHIMVSVYMWGNRCKQISLTKTCFRIAIKFDGSKLWSRYSVCLGGPLPWLLLHRLSMKWDIPLKRPEIWEKIKS